MAQTEDRRGLVRALAVAYDASAVASPNPGVGCVLSRDGDVVAAGTTSPAGGPHAEVAALRRAGAAAAGATAHVTLEPCAHHGRTPPCADALVAAGVQRVVYAVADPDDVAGGGGAALERAGVHVVGPLAGDDPLAVAAAGELDGFLTRLRTGRPHVTLKLAQHADGDETPRTDRRWVTGPAARRAVHRWRARCDVVLVGSGTVAADDPRLDVRDAPVVRQPRAAVIDTTLRTPAGAAVIRSSSIVLTADDDAARAAALRRAGAEVVTVSRAAGGDGVDLQAALAALARRGANRVFAEPGRGLATALLAAGLVDRLVLHVAGAADRTFTPGLDVTGWRADYVGTAGPDRLVEYVPETETT